MYSRLEIWTLTWLIFDLDQFPGLGLEDIGQGLHMFDRPELS